MKKVRIDKVLEVNWQECILPDAAYHHLIVVQRAQVGETIWLLDFQGQAFETEIVSIDNDQAVVKRASEVIRGAELPYDLYLVQGTPKADKIDLILQKGVELGVKKFFVVNFNRSVARFKDNESKYKRLTKIIGGAALQSGRGMIPELAIVPKLKDLLPIISELPKVLVIVAYEGELDRSLKACLTDYELSHGQPENIVICIGPEGGISREEIALLEGIGGQTVSLGSRILRTETAGLAVVAAVNYQFEN